MKKALVLVVLALAVALLAVDAWNSIALGSTDSIRRPSGSAPRRGPALARGEPVAPSVTIL